MSSQIERGEAALKEVKMKAVRLLIGGSRIGVDNAIELVELLIQGAVLQSGINFGKVIQEHKNGHTTQA